MTNVIDQIFAASGEVATSVNEAGAVRVQSQRSREYQANLLQVARLYKRVLEGDRMAAFHFAEAMRGRRFQEALTPSDFPQYFGDILDRQVLANYAETPYSWNMYCKRSTIQDFRVAKRFRIDRGAGVLDGPIIPNSYGATGSGTYGLPPVTEYPERKRTDDVYTLQLYKYGARMPFAWETIVNDDLDALKDTPALFGRAARRTEEKKVTELFVSSTGPNSTFFSVANGNILSSTVNSAVTTTNAPLSITALQQAMIVMASQRDLDGEPISITGMTLVVPPALEVVAKNIVNATEVWMNDQGGTIGNDGSLQRLITQNWARGLVKVAVNYYLPVVDTTHGYQAWYLFADPNNGRPALEMGFLRGHEQPELFMKLPNQVAIGEGRMGPGNAPMSGTNNMNPLEGDFDTDAIHYKVRHVLGGTTLDPIMAIASNGSGS